MARRVFRVLLILALAVLAGVTGWQVWSLDRTRTQQRADAERLQREALRATAAILDLRASQRAYLSPGQGITAWKPRVDAHLAALREQFHALREQASASPSPSAAAAAQADDEALDALVAARYLEQRIADHVTAGRFQHAADLVYADGVTGSLVLERAAKAAFTAHAQDLQAGRTRVQWTEGALLGLTAAIGFVLALLIMPARQAGAQAAATDEAAGDATTARDRATGDAASRAGIATAAGSAGSAGGLTERRPEPAAHGLGLSSGGRSAGAGASAAPGGAAGVPTGARSAGGASIPAAAARGGSIPAGRTTPAVSATGRGASAAAPPAISMADDLPLHAPVAAFPSAAAQSTGAQAKDRRDSLTAADANDPSATATSAGSSAAARQSTPQSAHAANQRRDLSAPSGVGEGSAMGTSSVSGTSARQTPHSAGAPEGGAAAAFATGSASGGSTASGGTLSSTSGVAGSAGATTSFAPGSTSGAAATTVDGLAVQTDDGMLAAAADLTAAVARVGDIDGLKPVMARLADHLDAVGLIVWLEDASTQRLTPIVTHGYPAETLAHLRPIDLDADNATARAWRLAELQIVPGRGTAQPGAIVVPMPSSAGCVGVIAAEVRHGREHDAATLDLARILAAQLAMLTGPRG